MKLTPLEIHQKEFSHSLRGYNEEQVDQFLDEVADDFERLFKENIESAKKLEEAEERVRTYQAMEATLNATMVSAQQSAQDIISKANAESDMMMRDAELKSKEIIHNALQKRQVVANELIRIKQAEEEFRARYRALLEGQMAAVAEVALADDVSILLGETGEGTVSAVEVRSAAPVEVAPEPVPEPEAVEIAVEAQETMLLDPVTASDAAWEPPTSGFVQSVTLGEVGEPDIPDGSVELVDPEEFSLPGFASLGERDADLDIEEID